MPRRSATAVRMAAYTHQLNTRELMEPISASSLHTLNRLPLPCTITFPYAYHQT